MGGQVEDTFSRVSVVLKALFTGNVKNIYCVKSLYFCKDTEINV